MLEDSRSLFYEYYHLWFVTKKKVVSGDFACSAMAKIKRYAKLLHRFTQSKVKRVVLERSAPCTNTFQKSNVLFIKIF